MSETCQKLHDVFNALPRCGAGYNSDKLPLNGIYILFEKGEKAHGGDRIVRIGTHRGNDRLHKRLNEHLYIPNKDRSIFRKHIGRALLAARKDNFWEQWEIGLTKKADREKYGNMIDREKLAKTENEVTQYITESFSFSLIKIDEKQERLLWESAILATISSCNDCKPSNNWLGLQHPNSVIRNSGLWNIQGIGGLPVSFSEADKMLRNLT